MAYKVYPIPNFEGTAVDLALCDPAVPAAAGVVHYAYAVATEGDAISRRTFPWSQIRDFSPAKPYAQQHPEVLLRIQQQNAYRPGEGVLDRRDETPDSDTDHQTIMRLGALELLANISSGRLAPNDKDPFPHQLALQQYVRNVSVANGPRRFLIADEVGLGKTIEVGLILRDILVSQGQMDKFSCLYLTSAGLVEDAAGKLRGVLRGAIDGNQIVSTETSFRRYGIGNIAGVHVASMHAARRYVTAKGTLPDGVRPDILVIDECHHAASDKVLDGVNVGGDNSTETFRALKQMLEGNFWRNSCVPKLVIFMSATPFRSANQFVNLLRLLAHRIHLPGNGVFNAFEHGVDQGRLMEVLADARVPANVVWRRQTDDGVRSWAGNLIFPNLTIMRPHQMVADPATPQLQPPSSEFLELLGQIKQAVITIANNNGQAFGGFAIAQLEKKLTSSTIAGACYLFSWAVKHCSWPSKAAYEADDSDATLALRQLIREISQKLATFHAGGRTFTDVTFPSYDKVFAADSLVQGGRVKEIYDYSSSQRGDDGDKDDCDWTATPADVKVLCRLAMTLLGFGLNINVIAAENTKLAWLGRMLELHPNDRFLLFTESLQTCEILKHALGAACVTLIGDMTKFQRDAAVEALRDPQGNARVLVATSAADEGFDLQVACKVIHWDLSPSPATLMQRNGRVARLGQIRDVIAYYLILTGTHEERRDAALQERFAQLGIGDPLLQSRVLGALTEEEQEQLETAIRDGNANVVGGILLKAKTDNETMDQELQKIKTELNASQVLSREDLEKRLRMWKKIGLPDRAVGGVTFEFAQINWDRPIFGDNVKMLNTTSSAASVTDTTVQPNVIRSLVFDPEYLLFGRMANQPAYKLAGLAPWKKYDNYHGRPCVVPHEEGDVLGKVIQQVARLGDADFLCVPRTALANIKLPHDAQWLLFCTHPLRESETIPNPRQKPFLTFYPFANIANVHEGVVPQCLNDDGAPATQVHELLCALETHAINMGCDGVADQNLIDEARSAGKVLQRWVEDKMRYGRIDFTAELEYFVPIPVALVRLR